MNNKPNEESLQQGHRARLRQKFLANQLNEPEILELLLTYAVPRRDVRLLSRQLHKKYGSLYQVLSAPVESLMQNPGVKENIAAFFKIIHELMALEYKHVLDTTPIFYDHTKLENYCRLILDSKPIEEFHVLYMDAQFKLIEDQLHSTGTTDWAAIYVREIAKRALDLNAKHIALVHNHPTPNISFSSQDIEITEEIESILQKLDIGLYDHFVVSGGVVYSARNSHMLNTKH